jgi:DDE superfamily endonuclease
MPQGSQVEVMTTGKNEGRSLAGALARRTGPGHHGLWFRKRTGLFLDLLNRLDRAYPVRRFDRVYVVADNGKIHKAAAVPHWRRPHPRFRLLFLPTYGAGAHPSERCFGDLHDKVRRNHRRKRRRDRVSDGQKHLAQKGPWPYRRSAIDQEAEVTQALQAALPDSAVA